MFVKKTPNSTNWKNIYILVSENQSDLKNIFLWPTALNKNISV